MIDDAVQELLGSYKPKDAIEAMLLAQMGATHNLSMVAITRAGIETKGCSTSLKDCIAVSKLLNLFTRQMEALSHYRGKSSTQKIVVEQVKVEKGGQAVVGHITSREG